MYSCLSFILVLSTFSYLVRYVLLFIMSVVSLISVENDHEYMRKKFFKKTVCISKACQKKGRNKLLSSRGSQRDMIFYGMLREILQQSQRTTPL